MGREGILTTLGRRRWLVGFWCGLLGLVTLLVFQAFRMYPVLDGDAIAFLPSILTFKQSGQLINEIYADARTWDPAGIGRLVHHGVLYQMLLGVIMPSPTYGWLRLVMASLIAATILLAGSLYRRALSRRDQVFGPGDCFLAAMGILTVLSVTIAIDGRPESLVMLLGILAIELSLVTGKSYEDWIMGAAAGLMVAASPAPGAIFFAAYSVWIASKHDVEIGARKTFKAALAALAVVAIVFMLYPYPIGDWVKGMLIHGSAVTGRANRWEYLHYWMLKPEDPFVGAVLLCGFFLILVNRKRLFTETKNKLYFWCMVSVFSGVTWLLALSTGERPYNLTAFIPLAVGLILREYTALKEFVVDHPWRVRIMKVLLVLCLIGGSSGYLRSIILFPVYLKYGMAYEEARDRLNRLWNSREGPLWISSGLFTLVEDYKGIQIYGVGRRPRWIMMQQVNSGRSIPESIPGYKVVENRFSLHEPRLFGIPMASSPRGYNYAIYQRDD